jgi:hypothetical protein
MSCFEDIFETEEQPFSQVSNNNSKNQTNQ